MWEDKYECMVPPKPGTVWPCEKDSSLVDYAVIDWGHQPRDGKWACNKWFTSCDKRCTVKESFWGSYAPLNEGLKRVNTVHIHWGHTAGDAGWACNKWHGECDNKCIAYPDGRNKPISDIKG